MHPVYKLRHYLIYAMTCGVVFFLFYGNQLELWRSQLPGSGEDGAKNAYTVAYHIKHDRDLVWFEGMNFPWGEHVLFTDNQPLVSNSLKLISEFTPFDLSGHFALVILVFLSFALGGWCLSDVSIRLGSPPWFAVLASVGIMLLSPQWMRFSGHYSLAYGGIIPFCIWLLYHASTKGGIWWILASVWVLATGFVHPYFLLMLTLLLVCFLTLQLWKSSATERSKLLIKSALISLSPIVVFQTIMWITDPVQDRPDSPFGFILYRSTWSSILLPLELDYFKSDIWQGLQSEEGSYYIGLFAEIGLILGLIPFLFKRLGSPEEMFSKQLLLASLPILLLAVAFPFYLWKLEFLIEYLGPLKQFRGIGRFAFVFFYVANFFALIRIGKFAVKSKAASGFVIMLIVALYAEAFQWRNQVLAKTSSGSTLFTKNPWSVNSSKINADQYQAILPMPGFHKGSENFYTEDIPGIQEQSFALSLATGLPLISVQMSRTSLSQTLQTLQLWSELLCAPELYSSFKNEKPLLILVKSGYPLSLAQLSLLKEAKQIHFGVNEYELFELDINTFEKIAETNLNYAKNLDSTLFVDIGADTSSLHYFYNSFDGKPSDLTYSGEGAMQFQKNDWTLLLPDRFEIGDTHLHELSFWFYADKQHAVNTQLWYWERDAEKEVAFEVTEVGSHIAAVDGKWILCSIPIRLENAKNTLELRLHRDGQNSMLWLDELLLRPAQLNVRKNGAVNLNNRFYKHCTQ